MWWRLNSSVVWIAIAWLGTVLILAGFTYFFDENPGPRTFALPLMFWTFFGCLVVVGTANAIFQPMPRAAFWRALMLSLAAFTIEGAGTTFVFENAVDFLPATIRRQVPGIWGGDGYWVWLFLAGVSYLLASLTTASFAWWIATKAKSESTGRFQFRLAHLFALSAFVAATFGALRADNTLALRILILGGAGLRWVAAVIVAARPRALFCWGFLAGHLAWSHIINYEGIALEWELIFPEGFATRRGAEMTRVLLPVYAGLATGYWAAVNFRYPQEVPTPREKPRGAA